MASREEAPPGPRRSERRVSALINRRQQRRHILEVGGQGTVPLEALGGGGDALELLADEVQHDAHVGQQERQLLVVLVLCACGGTRHA